MQILFSDQYAINPQAFGINFEAIVDGSSVICMISTEALQDIDPSNAQRNAQDQFTSNRSAFEQIAEKKIRDKQLAPIVITSTDVRA